MLPNGQSFGGKKKQCTVVLKVFIFGKYYEIFIYLYPHKDERQHQ